MPNHYNLAVPTELFAELERAAKQREITVVELMVRFIKVGLVVMKVEDDPDSRLYIRRGDSEREVVLTQE